MSGKERLPSVRNAKNHKFKIGEHKGYITAGFYPDGRVGEVFIKMDKSAFNGLTASLGIMISIALQWGVPLEDITSKLKFIRFEPSGPTGNPAIPMALSITDYLAKWLEHEFLK